MHLKSFHILKLCRDRCIRLITILCFLIPAACGNQIGEPTYDDEIIIPDPNYCSIRIKLDVPGITRRFADTSQFISSGSGDRPFSLGLGCYQIWDVEFSRSRTDHDRVTREYLDYCDRLIEWRSPSGFWTYPEPFAQLKNQWNIEQHAGFFDDRTQSRVINLLLQAYRISGDHKYLDTAKSSANSIMASSPRLPLGQGFILWSYVNLGDESWKPSIASFNHNLSTIDAFLNLYYYSGDYTYLHMARQMLLGFQFISACLIRSDGTWNYGFSVSGDVIADSVWVDSDLISGYQDLETSCVEQIQTRLDFFGYPRIAELDQALSIHVALRWAIPCQFRACSQYLLRVDPAVWDQYSFSFRLRGEEFPLHSLPTLSGPGFISQFGPITLFKGYTSIDHFVSLELNPDIIYSFVQDDAFSLLTAARVKRVYKDRSGYFSISMDRLNSCRDGYLLLEPGRRINNLDPEVQLKAIASSDRGQLYRFNISRGIEKEFKWMIE